MSTPSPRIPHVELGMLFALALIVPAPACGPDFPNTYFAAPAAEILASPEGYFADEIARIAIPKPPERAITAPTGESVTAFGIRTDVAEVRRALAAGGRSAAEAKALGSAYADARMKLATWARAGAELRAWNWYMFEPPQRAVEEQRQQTKIAAHDAALPDLSLPAALPAEFTLYFQGAVAWDQRKWDDARTAWGAVLALPAAERRERSVWAAYMLGRLEAEQANRDYDSARKVVAATAAAQSCQQVRALAAGGDADPLGLAAASYGWEAKAALAREDFVAAIRLYLTQLTTGDPTAINSLRNTTGQVANSDIKNLAPLARDETARLVLTAYFISLGGTTGRQADSRLPAEAQQWAIALDHEGIRDVPDADRLAWVAYEGGLFALAQQWAALAPATAPEAEWIRAKLALRAGNLHEGEARLRSALAQPALVEAHRHIILGELGRVCLAQDETPAALTAWMDGLHWEDAAYLAEHVLSVPELRAYVDANCPPGRLPTDEIDWSKWTTDYLRLDLRHLLARRLVRADQFDDAAKYYPDNLRATFDSYLADVRLGYDNAKPAADRAAAFWRAAQSADQHGLTLFGTELEPDWAIWGGSYNLGSTAAFRLGVPHLEGGILAPTVTELDRLKANPVPDKRYSYRYRAAELAWWAASLLPNDSDETARILYTAGKWLAPQDAPSANRFYQALVIRCGNTALGRAAAKLHWFPPQPPAP